MPDYSFARAWNTVADLAPNNVAIICGPKQLTFAEFRHRSLQLAAALSDRGVISGDKVAIQLVNGQEYLEVFYAALILGCTPVNVNYRYVGAELAYLIENSDSTALIFHDDFCEVVSEAIEALKPEHQPKALLRVAHASRVAHLANDDTTTTGDDYETALAVADPNFTTSHQPSGDDLIFLYTGGTTGYPKGVMWRNDDLYRALWQMSRPGTEPPDPAVTIGKGRRAATVLPACPLMHGTGLFITLSTLAGGGKVVLIDSQRLDPKATWDAVESEAVAALTIVGDAFARPLIDALDTQPNRWNLTSLRAITSSGVTWSPECKRALMAHLPGVAMIDSLGASEGVMTRSVATESADIKPARFTLSDRVAVIADDDTLIVPGDSRIGMVGVGGPIPLGYYKDPEKTAQTFRTVAGTRYSIPGDYATVEPDATITLLGRGSACINSGGEKIYPEEIELVARAHPEVIDCLVVGVPDDRWGEMVVALVVVRGTSDEAALRQHCRATLAGYKVPKRFIQRDSLERAANGKADYTLLRGVAIAALNSHEGPT